MVPVAVGAPLVIVGAVGGLTVNETDCAGDGPFVFVAITENVVVPKSVAAGIPLSTPVLALSVAHAGGAPGRTTAHPPLGIVWDAAKVCVNATPVAACNVAALVITGGTTLIVTV